MNEVQVTLSMFVLQFAIGHFSEVYGSFWESIHKKLILGPNTSLGVN